jgi:AP-1-like factor
MELREYRKRLSGTGVSRSPPLGGGLPPYLAKGAANNNTVSNPSDVNFQFEFPKFGRLPGPPVLNASSFTTSDSRQPSIPGVVRRENSSSSNNGGSISPLDQSKKNTNTFGSVPINNHTITQNTQMFDQLNTTNMSSFSDLFTPGELENLSKDFSFDQPAPVPSNASRSSTDLSNGPNSTGQNTTYSSPSASSNVGSNAGLSSSCGTSPEPYTQSPAGLKSNDNMLTTIGEENPTATSGEGEASFCEKLKMACGNPANPIPRTMSESGVTSGNLQIPAFDINGIDWFAQQNGNQFDPQLFGDYREPQNNILSGGLYDDTFFAEAFALPEFNTNSPFVMAASPAASKKDLVQEIDQKLSQDDEVVPGEDRGSLMTCNTMW